MSLDMMHLPEHDGLPVNRLAACFRSTVLTYKFYWFLGILNRVENGESEISKQSLFAEMVGHAWFTVNYFHISFGKQDKLQQAIETLRDIEVLTLDANRSAVVAQLSVSGNPATQRALRHFNAEVPHRFLSPWFPASDKRAAELASKSFTNECPYALYQEHIEINPKWVNYLQRNVRILRDFCYWNLALYLQTRNPNVPDIPNKLIKQPVRKALTQQRKFWDIVIGELGSVDCIYTNSRLTVGNYAVEHFLPYAFVSHDLMWNLIPADGTFNSAKSDKLPPFDTYFPAFFQLQQSALEIVQHKEPRNKLLADYLTIVPHLSMFEQQRVFEQLQPLVTIANNNGFEYMQKIKY